MPLALVPLIIGDWLWLLFLEIITIISVFELIQMYQQKYHKKTIYLLFCYPIAAISLLISYIHPPFIDQPFFYLLILLLTIVFIAELFLIKEAKLYFKKTFYLRIIAYSSFFLPFLMLLRSSEYGLTKMFLLLLVVWAYDSFAYIFGVAFGKHKFMPLVSPKKSIEGIIGGFIGSSIVAAIYLMFFGKVLMLNFYEFGMLMIFSVFLAQSGDLIESFIKRMLSAKDSGSLIPGHGGVLDRLDSFFLLAPAFYYLLEKVFS
jgi:phosphatidate cytidylyltransferase